MTRTVTASLCLLFLLASLRAQTPQPVSRFLQAPYMKGATLSLIVTEVESGNTVCQYDADREVTPASVLKIVTTATALEVLGDGYRFPTSLEYEGAVEGGVLRGNLYIKGSGDPTLGSEHFANMRNTFIATWIDALKKAGIRSVDGSVIADESILDTEGISPKWVNEDMGSYYGAGSYGINVFDNLYRLTLQTGAAGTRPVITGSDPGMGSLRFHNYLTAATVSADSSYILGAPFAGDRYLYGTVPANRNSYTLKGDIPDPALFLATYLTRRLQQEGIAVGKKPACHRLLSEAGEWKPGKRHTLCTTYSPTLGEIVRITNHHSHNLYADALLKKLGQSYRPHSGEILSDFGRGIREVVNFWKEKGVDTFPLRMYDGNGLASADKVSARFIGNLLGRMAVSPETSDVFIRSLPQAGVEGSVRNFLKGTSLQGKTRLKSGGMSGVRSYAGYVTQNGKRYAVAVFVNNYACEARILLPALENMLMALLSPLGE